MSAVFADMDAIWALLEVPVFGEILLASMYLETGVGLNEANLQTHRRFRQLAEAHHGHFLFWVVA